MKVQDRIEKRENKQNKFLKYWIERSNKQKAEKKVMQEEKIPYRMELTKYM